MRKLPILILLLALIPVSLASPPSQYSTKGLTIDYPKNEFYIQNQNLTIFFRVYNSSGHQLPWGTDTPACQISIFNGKGDHLVFKNLTYNSTYTAWNISFFTPSTNLTGRFAYSVYCYNTVEQGFLSTYFEITGEGKESSAISRSVIEASALIFFIFLITLCFVSALYVRYTPFRIMLLVLAVFFLIYTINIIAIMLENEVGNPNILAVFQRFGAIGYVLLYGIMGMAFVYFFIWAINLIAQRKEDTALRRAGMVSWGE